MTGFMAALSLRMFPAFARPFVHWFLPHCRKLRSQVQQARDLIRPVILRRQQDKAAAVERGESPVEFNDGIEWSDLYANDRPFDRVDLQLGLSIAAVHNTTDLLSQVVYDLASDPDMVERLRNEASEVIGAMGWSKTSLYNLKLLDSVIKESMRIKPILTGKNVSPLPFTLVSLALGENGTNALPCSRHAPSSYLADDPGRWSRAS